MTRHNRIHAWAAGISAAHRYLITAIFVGTLWAAWFFCFYTRYNQKIATQRQELALMHTQKTQMQCLAQACTQEEQKVAELQTQLAPYSEFLESAQPLERVQARMLDIINFTKKAGLSLISCSMGPTQVDQKEEISCLPEQPESFPPRSPRVHRVSERIEGNVSKGSLKQAINLTVTGSLPALYAFLAAVKDSKKMIQCSRVQLEREHDSHYRMITEFYILAFKEKKIPST